MGCLVRYSTYSTYSKEPGESGCSVACLVRYSTYSTCSKEPGESEGSAGRRSVRAAFCMVFACFFCNMWNSLFFAWFLQHVEQLVFLHDMWNSLFFCNMWNSLFFLHDTWNSLHGFACLHVMWFNPVELPLPPVFSCQAARVRCRSWRTSVGGGAVSGHLTKCAEQARCRAGT